MPELPRQSALKRTTELQSDPEKVRDFQKRGRSNSRPKRSKPIGTVSEAQREKVRGLSSIVSAQSPCDPAHLWPTARGGCTDPDCVVPLTRAEHDAFDARELDLLPDLIDRGCWRELAHMVAVHQVDPIAMIDRLTGERHYPDSQIEIRARRLAIAAGVEL
jgi:hypothetical protein